MVFEPQPKYELLASNSPTYAADVLMEFMIAEKKFSWSRINDLFRTYEVGMYYAYSKAHTAQQRRYEMPVLTSLDVAELFQPEEKTTLYVEIGSLTPIQCQIHTDTSAYLTLTKGVGTLYLRENDLLVDIDGKIIDGHHRWFSLMLVDARQKVHVTRVKASYEGIRDQLLAFSDAHHARNT